MITFPYHSSDTALSMCHRLSGDDGANPFFAHLWTQWPVEIRLSLPFY